MVSVEDELRIDLADAADDEDLPDAVIVTEAEGIGAGNMCETCGAKHGELDPSYNQDEVDTLESGKWPELEFKNNQDIYCWLTSRTVHGCLTKQDGKYSVS